MMKLLGYLFLSIIFFWSAYGQFKQKRRNNEIILKGIVLDAVIVKKPENCYESVRNKNYIKVYISNESTYTLRVDYTDCINLKIGDTIKVLYNKDLNEILRFNAEAKPSKYLFEIVMAFLGMISLGYTIFYITRKN